VLLPCRLMPQQPERKDAVEIELLSIMTLNPSLVGVLPRWLWHAWSTRTTSYKCRLWSQAE
jgi:hypothetical protein